MPASECVPVWLHIPRGLGCRWCYPGNVPPGDVMRALRVGDSRGTEEPQSSHSASSGVFRRWHVDPRDLGSPRQSHNITGLPLSGRLQAEQLCHVERGSRHSMIVRAYNSRKKLTTVRKAEWLTRDLLNEIRVHIPQSLGVNAIQCATIPSSASVLPDARARACTASS